jgi:hypothetical protein
VPKIDYSPSLIEQLYCAADYPDLTIDERAQEVEKPTRERHSTPLEETSVMPWRLTLSLVPGTFGRNLPTPGTSSRLPWHTPGDIDMWMARNPVFRDLVNKIYRLQPTIAPFTYPGMRPHGARASLRGPLSQRHRIGKFHHKWGRVSVVPTAVARVVNVRLLASARPDRVAEVCGLDERA